MTVAYHQWLQAGLWWWHCQQCWGPGSCSIPCLSVRHLWWSGPHSEIQKTGWRAEEVGRRRADSVGGKNISLNFLSDGPFQTNTLSGACFVYLTAFPLPENGWLWVSSGLALEGDSSANPNHLVPWSDHKCWGHWRTAIRMVSKRTKNSEDIL